MKEKHLHKLIRDSATTSNAPLVAALKKAHPELAQPIEAKPSSRERVSKRLQPVFVTLAAVAAAGVVTVIALIPTPSVSGETVDNAYGMFYSSPKLIDCDKQILNTTVQEYNSINNTDILFFKSVTDDYNLVEYRYRDESNFVALEAYIARPSAYENIDLLIYTPHPYLDFLSGNECVNITVMAGTSVKWLTSHDGTYGLFGHGGYEYYLFVDKTETRLFSLIKELLFE